MELPTREKILELLQRSPNLTAAEMARILRVTRHDIRYHLKFLLSQGLVVQASAAFTIGGASPGRPANVYQLSASARPEGITALADTMLDMGRGSSLPQAFLDELAVRFMPAPAPDASQTHMPQRLTNAIQILNQHPYQARWEAHSAGPEVILGNCPFSAIIEGHPELCQVDRRIIENLSGLHAVQIRKIDFQGSSSAVCIFLLPLSSQD